MTHLRTVPVVVIILGLLAAGGLVALQQRADDARRAQVTLEQLKLTVNRLQDAAFKASEKTGGSPDFARTESARGKREIAETIRELRAASPPAALAGLPPTLKDYFTTLDAIRAIGASKSGYDARADQLAAEASGQGRVIDGALERAGAVYDRRAEAATLEIAVGGIGIIALLLAAFSLYFRRAALARRVADRLAADNQQLLAASRQEALVDALTGLHNRRALGRDLDARLARIGAGAPLTLALFDLDGFKQYNDTFGHPAGDALLNRLGQQLRAALADEATAYRIGGDEFCVLTDDPQLVALAAEALSESGDVFDIGCSYGTALLPTEADTAEDALRFADQRLYEHKNGRSSASRQSTDVLLKVLSERNDELHAHLSDVAQLARTTAERTGLPAHEVGRIGLGAELHDVGKSALPDSLLDKPGPLNAEEWGFMREHTVIGDRIVRAAPSLAHAADLVRSSHERFDGGGYPDGLRGAEIPLGASIIAVCDAFDVMTSDRPYADAVSTADALAELRECAGTQFDPAVVATFCAVVDEPAAAARA